MLTVDLLNSLRATNCLIKPFKPHKSATEWVKSHPLACFNRTEYKKSCYNQTSLTKL